MSSSGRVAATKRQRAAPVQDDRALIVRNDDLRSGMSGINVFFERIISERDNLQTEVSKMKSDIEELANKVEILEIQEAGHKQELDLSKISTENHRSIAEKVSEEKKHILLDNTKLESLLKRECEWRKAVEKELIAANLRIGETEGMISNLQLNLGTGKQELNKTMDDNKKLSSQFLTLVATKDKEIGESALRIQTIEADLAKEKHESEHLKETVTQLNLHVEALEANDNSVDLHNQNEELQNDIVALEVVTKQAKDRLKAVEDIFHDAVRMDNVGFSVLLDNGSMVPAPLVYKQWMDAKLMFSGMPNYSIKCNRTSTMASVVHDQATCAFVTRVAKSTSLDTNLPSYFRYSERPSDFTGRLVWEEYKLYDQLTLMAKLINMLKQPTYSSRFQVTLSDNHVVTAKYTYTMATDEVELQFALSVISDSGDVKKHRIDFVDTPYAVGGTFATKILPDNVKIVTEL